MDKRFLCIWAEVELDNSQSDRQRYLGQKTTLFLLLPSISSLPLSSPWTTPTQSD